jgi:hypothetical protein
LELYLLLVVAPVRHTTATLDLPGLQVLGFFLLQDLHGVNLVDLAVALVMQRRLRTDLLKILHGVIKVIRAVLLLEVRHMLAVVAAVPVLRDAQPGQVLDVEAQADKVGLAGLPVNKHGTQVAEEEADMVRKVREDLEV